MMMGMSLMYSLLHPIDVQRVSVECAPYFKMQDTQLIQQNPTALALPQPHTAAAVKQADVLPLQEIHNVMNNQEQVHFQQDFNMLPALPNANVTNTELVLYDTFQTLHFRTIKTIIKLLNKDLAFCKC